MSIFLWMSYVVCAVASLGIGIFQLRPTSIRSGEEDGELNFMAQIFGSLSVIWVPALVLEITLVAATALKAYQVRQSGKNSELISTLFRDGFAYFVGVFVLMLVNLCICLFVSDSILWGLLVEPSLCIIALLATRVFLNLRATAYGDELDSYGTSHGLANTLTSSESSEWEWDVERRCPTPALQSETGGPHTAQVWHG